MGQGQGEPGGGSGGQSGGYGEGGTALAFKTVLTGYSWAWDSKAGDPRLWTGTASEPVISDSGFVWGSAADALAGGRKDGDANTNVMKVTVTANYAGFAGAGHIYTDRWEAAVNAPAAEKAKAYDEYTKTGELKLDEPIDWGDWPLKLLVIGGIIAVAVYYLFIKKGAAPALPVLPAGPAPAVGPEVKV